MIKDLLLLVIKSFLEYIAYNNKQFNQVLMDLHTDPNPQVEKKWRYWKRCFQNFQTKISETVPAADATEEVKQPRFSS